MRTLMHVNYTLLRVAALAITVLGTASLISTGVEARAGSWCSSYHEGGGACGYESQVQCLDSVRGIGGLCLPNYREDWSR
jgi:hypothetical protein